MIIKDFLEEMNNLAPFESAYEWDNVGLLVGDPKEEITGIYLALDLDFDVIEGSKDSVCNLIITHHPMIFKPMNRVVSNDVNGKKIIDLVKNNLNYIALHTNFDVHIMWKLVAEKLGFKDFKVLDVTKEENGVPMGIGTVCDLPIPMALKELCELVKEKMNLPFVTCYGQDYSPVKRVAVVPGSGKSEIKKAIDSGADVLITGDITHHEGIDALDAGLTIIDAGHDGLENAFINYMKDYIISHFKDIIVVTKHGDLKRRMV